MMPLSSSSQSLFNASTHVGSALSYPSSTNGSQERISFVSSVFINILLAILCVFAASACLGYALYCYVLQREERDKLCKIVSTRYWTVEDSISYGLQTIAKLRGYFLTSDVSAYHILCYKFRNGQLDYNPYNISSQHRNSFEQKSHVYYALRCIARLFDSVNLELKCRGTCPESTSSVVGPVIFRLARETMLAWTDPRASVVGRLVRYFAGRSCADTFRSGLMPDSTLANLVRSQVPYIDDLCFSSSGDRFVMGDVDSNDSSMRAIIRRIDIALSIDEDFLRQYSSKDKKLREACKEARDLCLKRKFISEELCKFDITVSSLKEVVIKLRHLLRLLYQTGNMRKSETDDMFIRLINRIHDEIKLTDQNFSENVNMEVVGRTRDGVCILVHKLTSGHGLASLLLLEKLEKNLQHHIDNFKNANESSRGKLSSGCLRRKCARIISSDSEASVYTMAQSTSFGGCFALANTRFSLRSSLDHSSLRSGSSSMYNTAVSAMSSPVNLHSPEDSDKDGLETPV